MLVQREKEETVKRGVSAIQRIIFSLALE